MLLHNLELLCKKGPQIYRIARVCLTLNVNIKENSPVNTKLLFLPAAKDKEISQDCRILLQKLVEERLSRTRLEGSILRLHLGQEEKVQIQHYQYWYCSLSCQLTFFIESSQRGSQLINSGFYLLEYR